MILNIFKMALNLSCIIFTFQFLLIFSSSISKVLSCNHPEYFKHENFYRSIFRNCTFHINISPEQTEGCRNDNDVFPSVLNSGLTPPFSSKGHLCTVGIGFSRNNSYPPNLTFQLTFLPVDDIGVESQSKWIQTLDNSTTIHLVVVHYKNSNNLTHFLVCPHCPQPFIKLDLENLNPESIYKEWFSLNKNLHQRSIFYPDRDPLQGFSKCEKLGIRFLGEERICAIKFIITSKMNGTVVYEDGKLPIIGTVRIALLEFLDTSTYEFLHNGYLFQPFTFSIVLDKSTGRKQNGQPLDSTTENLKMLTIFVLSLIFSIKVSLVLKNENVIQNFPKQYHKKHRLFKKIIKATREKRIHGRGWKFLGFILQFVEDYVQLMMPLFDQCHHRIERRLQLKRSDHIFFLLLALWLFLASVVLANAYKGALYHTLTRDTPIDTPETLHELITTTDLSLITTDYTDDPKSGGSTSVLGNLIHQHLNSGRIPKNSRETYELLQKRFKLLKVFVGIIIGAYETHVDIGTLTTEDGPYYLPMNFAFVGFGTAVLHFVTLIKYFPNVFVIQNSYEDLYLSLKLVTAASKNSFGIQLFPKFYNRLHESGIYDLWKKYRANLFLRWDADIINCLISTQNPQEKFNKKGCYYAKKLTQRLMYPKGERIGGLKLGVFIQLCYFLFGSLGLSIGIFLIELIIKSIQNHLQIKKQKKFLMKYKFLK